MNIFLKRISLKSKMYKYNIIISIERNFFFLLQKRAAWIIASYSLVYISDFESKEVNLSSRKINSPHTYVCCLLIFSTSPIPLGATFFYSHRQRNIFWLDCARITSAFISSIQDRSQYYFIPSYSPSSACTVDLNVSR